MFPESGMRWFDHKVTEFSRPPREGTSLQTLARAASVYNNRL